VDASSISSTNDMMISPIRNLEPSLEASQAHSTLVAVSTTKGNIAVVLVTRQSSSMDKYDHDHSSSSTSTTTEQHNGLEQMTEKYGIPIMTSSSHDRSSIRESSIQSQTTWTRVGSSCMMGMTGFLPDILHLTKYISRSQDSFVQVYNQPSPSSSFKLVSILSQKLDMSTRDEGSRPYGVQVLFIMAEETQENNDKNPNSGSKENASGTKKKKNALSLVTLDPTGVWRHHAKGRAVVGRYTSLIRPLLWGKSSTKSLVDNDNESSSSPTPTVPKIIEDPSQALKVAMKAMLQGRLNAGIKTTTSGTVETNNNNKLIYEAHLVWTNGQRKCQTAQIHPLAVHTCRKECLEELLLKQ